ncbi:MAG: alpha/beta fold hydrolase [Planctomycetota bacterium]
MPKFLNCDCLPVDADSRTLPPWRAHYPFASHEATVGGQWRMHYVDECPAEPTADDAPTMLFVHGNPTWSFHWRRLIAEFAADYRCVAPDHIGCGLSQKPAASFRLADRIDHLVELIDQLDLQQVTLVAQDWGGAIGLGALLRRRERFRGVLLLNTGAFRPWFIPWRIRVCRTPLLGRLALQGGNLFSLAALRMTTNRRPLPKDIAQAYLAPHDCWEHRRAVYDFVEDIPLSAAHPTWQTLGQIEDALPSLAHLPINMVWGMQDWCFTPECLRKFQAAWPHANARELPDAGHWVLEDAPEEVAAALRSLLKHSAATQTTPELAE